MTFRWAQKWWLENLIRRKTIKFNWLWYEISVSVLAESQDVGLRMQPCSFHPLLNIVDSACSSRWCLTKINNKSVSIVLVVTLLLGRQEAQWRAAFFKPMHSPTLSFHLAIKRREKRRAMLFSVGHPLHNTTAVVNSNSDTTDSFKKDVCFWH